MIHEESSWIIDSPDFGRTYRRTLHLRLIADIMSYWRILNLILVRLYRTRGSYLMCFNWQFMEGILDLKNIKTDVVFSIRDTPRFAPGKVKLRCMGTKCPEKKVTVEGERSPTDTYTFGPCTKHNYTGKHCSPRHSVHSQWMYWGGQLNLCCPSKWQL